MTIFSKEKTIKAYLPTPLIVPYCFLCQFVASLTERNFARKYYL